MANDYNSKRFYWIKLRENFMTSDAVDFLMGQKEGANYVVLYQMLCLKTANTGGELSRTIGEMIIPYDVDKITRDVKWFSKDTVIVALELYKKLGLIFKNENGNLVISNYDKMVGSETQSAIYKQDKKQLENFQPNSNRYKDTKILDNKSIDIDIDNNISMNKKEDLFELFWKEYPKKIAKGNTEKWFSKNKPNKELVDKMILQIERFKDTKDWKKENGQFIPYPTSWLNAKMWEDEFETETEKEEKLDKEIMEGTYGN